MIYNPAGLYGGGAFKVDMQPVINYVLKKQAQEEAARKALEKDFEKSMTYQTPAGMRGTEADAYSQAIQNVKSYFNNNKNRLLNGDVKATIEYEGLQKIPLQIAAESKQYNEDAKDYERITKTNPDIANLYTDETIGIDKATGQPLIDPTDNGYTGYYAHKQPSYIIDETGQVVKNPKFKRFDISKIAFKPKPIAPDEFSKMVDVVIGQDIQPVETSLGIVKDKKNPNYQREDVVIGYDDSDIKTIGDKMIQFSKDPRAKQYIHDNYPYQTFLDQNVDVFNKANETFKKYYGRDIAPGNEDELFAGIIMSQKANKKVKQGKLEATPEYRNALSEASSKRLAVFNKSLNPTVTYEMDNVKTIFENTKPGQYKTTKKQKVTVGANGLVYGADGKPYNSNGDFDIVLPIEYVDASIFDYGKKGSKISLIDDVQASVKDGKIQAVSSQESGLIPRATLLRKEFSDRGIKIPIEQISNVPLIQDKNVSSGSKTPKIKGTKKSLID